MAGYLWPVLRKKGATAVGSWRWPRQATRRWEAIEEAIGSAIGDPCVDVIEDCSVLMVSHMVAGCSQVSHVTCSRK